MWFSQGSYFDKWRLVSNLTRHYGGLKTFSGVGWLGQCCWPLIDHWPPLTIAVVWQWILRSSNFALLNIGIKFVQVFKFESPQFGWNLIRKSKLHKHWRPSFLELKWWIELVRCFNLLFSSWRWRLYNFPWPKAFHNIAVGQDAWSLVVSQ